METEFEALQALFSSWRKTSHQKAPPSECNLLDLLRLIDRLTGLKVKSEKLAADKAYSVRYFRRILRQRRIEPVIPKRKTRSKETRGRPVRIDMESYKKRHIVENVIGKVKEFRRVASRYDRHSESYTAMIYVALIKIQ